MIVKRLDVLSVGKVLGFVYAIVGLVAGVFLLLGAATYRGFLGMYEGPLGGGWGMMTFPAEYGFVNALLSPIEFGIAGFVGGVVFAWLYNLVVRYTGGIEFDTK